MQTALMLPVILISMPDGAIADMYDRRIVALVSLSIALSGATSLTVLKRPFGSVRWKEDSPDRAADELLPAVTPAGGST